MSYIFMDESGCLGFDFEKLKPSQYFIITFLLVENKRPLDKIIKHVFQGMDEKERRRHCGVLHATKEHPKIRFKVLGQLREKPGVQIIAIRLNKSKVYAHLHDEKAILYNFVTNILLDRLINKQVILPQEPIQFIASRRETSKFLNENFKNYLENQMNGRLNIEVIIDTPAHEKCLQLADFASWSIFRYYEHNDEQYYNIIRDLIIEDKSLF